MGFSGFFDWAEHFACIVLLFGILCAFSSRVNRGFRRASIIVFVGYFGSCCFVLQTARFRMASSAFASFLLSFSVFPFVFSSYLPLLFLFRAVCILICILGYCFLVSQDLVLATRMFLIEVVPIIRSRERMEKTEGVWWQFIPSRNRYMNRYGNMVSTMRVRELNLSALSDEEVAYLACTLPTGLVMLRRIVGLVRWHTT